MLPARSDCALRFWTALSVLCAGRLRTMMLRRWRWCGRDRCPGAIPAKSRSLHFAVASLRETAAPVGMTKLWLALGYRVAFLWAAFVGVEGASFSAVTKRGAMSVGMSFNLAKAASNSGRRVAASSSIFLAAA